MCNLQPRDISKISTFSVLYVLQLGVVFYSAILLTKRKSIYPIKQLSPMLTLMISISIIVVSTLLLISEYAEICDPYDTDNGVIAFLSILYTFFRQFIILAFYMRCLRICTAYFKVQKQIVILIFSNEMGIALVAAIISMFPAICQLIQFLIHKDLNKMTNFFPFYVQKSIPNPFDFIYMWVLDNTLFFIVLILSLTVHQRFKFLKSLVCACLLFHVESVYNLVGMFADLETQVTLRNDYEYAVMVIHTIFLILILIPSLQPNEYQFPLPIENTLLNHNTALLDNETYILISYFADKLETRSLTIEQKKRRASNWLEIYTTFKIAQRRIAQIQLQPTLSGSSQAEDSIRIREILFDYVYEQVIPNLDLKMVRENVSEVFLEDEQMGEESVREDLEIEHFQKLGRVLDITVSSIFKEWRLTVSYQILRNQFRENIKIINTMTKLKIGI